MGLSRRQRRQLLALDGELCADSRLAGLLGMFSRLTADEPMPGHEQLAARASWTGWLGSAARRITWAAVSGAADRPPSGAGRRRRPVPRWYELSLVAAAALAGGVGVATPAPAVSRPRQAGGMSGNPGPRRVRSGHPAG
jgi:hypothetical protein